MSERYCLTRRHALASFAVVATTGATTTLATPSTQHPDAAILRLADELAAAQRDADRVSKHHHQLFMLAQAQQSRCPIQIVDEDTGLNRNPVAWEVAKADRAVYDEWRTACQAIDDRFGVDDAERALEASTNRITEIEDAIMATPACSISGVAIKLRIMAAIFGPSLDNEDDGKFENAAFRSVLADLDRLAGRA